jgi:uncharacterized membrane protein YbhN (UPF0104 family)
MMSFLRRWHTPLRWMISGGALGLMASRVDWPQLGERFAKAHPGWLALSALLSVGVVLLMAWRWKLVLRACDLDVPFGATSEVTFIGQFFNSFLPGSTGGDVVKAWSASRWAPDRKAAPAVSIAYDRLLALLALFIVSAVALGLQAIEHANLRWLFERFLFLTLGALLSGIVAVLAVPRLAQQFFKKHSHHCRLAPDATRHFLAACGVALPTHLINCVAALCVAHAVDLDVDFWQVAVAVAFVNCSSLLPVSIAGHGLREAGFVFIFGLYGVLGAEGTHGSIFERVLAFSILFYARSLVSSVSGGFCYARVRLSMQNTSEVPGAELAVP